MLLLLLFLFLFFCSIASAAMLYARLLRPILSRAIDSSTVVCCCSNCGKLWMQQIERCRIGAGRTTAVSSSSSSSGSGIGAEEEEETIRWYLQLDYRFATPCALAGFLPSCSCSIGKDSSNSSRRATMMLLLLGTPCIIIVLSSPILLMPW